MKRDKQGRILPPEGPSYFKDSHDGISPIETFHGTKYLLKWPDFRRMASAGRVMEDKWQEEVVPWLVEKGIKIQYHDSRKSLMFPSKADALMFKLSWDSSDFS